jgi:hypothetical protein
MKVLSRATLVMAICSAPVFCQTAPSKDPQPSFSARDDVTAMDPRQPIGAMTFHDGIVAAPATFRMIAPFRCSTYKNGSYVPATLLRFNSCYAAQDAPEASRVLTPFSYTTAKDRFEYFPIKLGPVRYTFWSRTSQFNRPAAGRLQNVVDGLLRHYTSNPVVPVNERCLRWLSCNSLYKQALRRRAVASTTR